MGITKTKKTEHHAAPMSFYDATKLYQMKFQDVAFVITKMDTVKKAEMAAEIDPVLESLYTKANAYGNENVPYDEQPSAAQYMTIMGKIKHWETLLYWLFEIDIAMAQEELIGLAMEAELALERHRMSFYKLPEDKVRKYEKALKDIKKPEKERHTTEILDLAASLTKKYSGITA